MTVKENIACAVQDKTIRKQKTEQIMKTYDLMELADVYPSHLSGWTGTALVLLQEPWPPIHKFYY